MSRTRKGYLVTATPSDEPEESVTERIARERAEYEDHCERVFEERRDDELIGEIK